MTDHLSPESRALLDQTRDGHDPHPEDKARVKKAVLASIAASAAAAGTAEAASSAASSAGLGAGAKLGIAVLAAGAIATGAFFATATDPKPTQAPDTTPAPAQPAVVARVETPTPPVVQPEPEPEPKKVAPKKVRPAPAPAPEPEPARAKNTLAEEAKVLVEVRVALRDGRHEDVLTLATDYAAEYPNGALLEEALAAKVLALCALGRATEAADAKAALVEHAPRSAHLTRIANACK